MVRSVGDVDYKNLEE